MTPKKTQKTPQEDPKSTQASAEDISTGDNVDENEVTEKGFKGQQSKAMNSMGAYHQEENTEMDANQLSMVLNSLSLATQKKDKAAEKIAIKKEDLEVVVRYEGFFVKL